jgi:putative redox protein
MRSIEVEHQAERSARVHIGSHVLVVDQPFDEGGWDLGPTPTELFVARLAACVEDYAARFLARLELEPEGLRVECQFELSEGRPARVSRVELKVVVPVDFPISRRDALLAVVRHCTVHNSIQQAPEVAIAMDKKEAAA